MTTWAMRAAREHTRRPKIVMVHGTYHGAHAWCSPFPGGVYLHPFHNWFICAAHTSRDIDRALEIARTAFGLTGHERDRL